MRVRVEQRFNPAMALANRINRRIPPRRRLAAAHVAALALVLGCGGAADTVRLQGQVTLDGQPLPADAEGSISFQPLKGDQSRAAVAKIIDGQYDAPRAPSGRVKATISLVKPTGKMLDNGRGDPSPEYQSLIPADYGNVFDLELSDDTTENFNLTRS
jgi:hypothetical protein